MQGLEKLARDAPPCAVIACCLGTVRTRRLAADLGGDCCADLEERIAELEATTARKGNRKVSSDHLRLRRPGVDGLGRRAAREHLHPRTGSDPGHALQVQRSGDHRAGLDRRLHGSHSGLSTPIPSAVTAQPAINQTSDDQLDGLNAQMVVLVSAEQGFRQSRRRQERRTPQKARRCSPTSPARRSSTTTRSSLASRSSSSAPAAT